jgi:hypothetical protein
MPQVSKLGKYSTPSQTYSPLTGLCNNILEQNKKHEGYLVSPFVFIVFICCLWEEIPGVDLAVALVKHLEMQMRTG